MPTTETSLACQREEHTDGRAVYDYSADSPYDRLCSPCAVEVGFAAPCTNTLHDHEHRDDATGTVATCADCKHPMHYDYLIEAYQHDDPAAPNCFLIHRDATASACIIT